MARRWRDVLVLHGASASLGKALRKAFRTLHQDCIRHADALDVTQPSPDDRIEAVVSLVLQAVDQRLATVRDQMVQINNSVIHSHNQLQAQIDECRELCLSVADSVAAPPANDAASQQLMEVANVLTQHVASFEVRVNQYTNERVAELRAMVERLSIPAATPAPAAAFAPVSRPTPVTHTAPISRPTPTVASDDVAPAAARLGSLSSARAEPAAVAPLLTPVAAVAAPMPVAAAPMAAASAAPVAAAPLAAAPVAASNGPIDLDELTAQMSARLSAVIDRALAI